MPNGEDLTEMISVVVDIGQNMHGASTNECSKNDFDDEGRHPVSWKLRLVEPFREVVGSEGKREGKANAIGVNRQRS